MKLVLRCKMKSAISTQIQSQLWGFSRLPIAAVFNSLE